MIDARGKVLIAKRPEGRIMSGYWEFPGGKLHSGELPEKALRREVREELGIELGAFTPFSFISEPREDCHVIVYLFHCREWRGTAQGMEGQELAWVPPTKLNEYDLLPSNRTLLPLLQKATS